MTNFKNNDPGIPNILNFGHLLVNFEQKRRKIAYSLLLGSISKNQVLINKYIAQNSQDLETFRGSFNKYVSAMGWVGVNGGKGVQ